MANNDESGGIDPALVAKFERMAENANRRAKKQGKTGRLQYTDLIKIWERKHGFCCYCNRPLNLENISLDHVTPLKHGGKNEFFNCALCCDGCNKSKRDLRSAGFEAMIDGDYEHFAALGAEIKRQRGKSTTPNNINEFGFDDEAPFAGLNETETKRQLRRLTSSRWKW